MAVLTMDRAKKCKEDPDNVITVYINKVSPNEDLRKNSQYFNMTLQTCRNEYHEGVVRSPEKNSFSQAATNKTCIKLRGEKKVLGK